MLSCLTLSRGAVPLPLKPLVDMPRVELPAGSDRPARLTLIRAPQDPLRAFSMTLAALCVALALAFGLLLRTDPF
jgi:hypothetical protein